VNCEPLVLKLGAGPLFFLSQSHYKMWLGGVVTKAYEDMLQTKNVKFNLIAILRTTWLK